MNHRDNNQELYTPGAGKNGVNQEKQELYKRVYIILFSILPLILLFGLGFSAIYDAGELPENRTDRADNKTEFQDPPPPQVLKDLLLPGDLWELYRAANIRLERNEIRYARSPAQSVQSLHNRWNEDLAMEAALHAHGNWDEIRTTAIGTVRYIEPRSGMLRRLMVKMEDSDIPGFQRWVYYQYEDLSELGMDDHFIPRVAVDAASDGSEAYFVRLDPDGLSGIGHFGKTGWSIVDGRKILWVYTIPTTQYSTAIYSHEESGDTVTVKFYTTAMDFQGELKYSKTDGSGSFMAQGQNENKPICWDSAMVNSEC
ncbi:MAG: hypothetical protein EA390_14900 [Balneolaceae bacterium]|nr:MAG: hypothetical protein EA390_14900 [Balneolaceae bacterium]